MVVDKQILGLDLKKERTAFQPIVWHIPHRNEGQEMLQVWFSGKGRGWFCFKLQSGILRKGEAIHLFLYSSVHTGVSRPTTSFLLRLHYSRCLASIPSICAALSFESIWISYERNELLSLPQQHVRM
jgi:hypothetical protein